MISFGINRTFCHSQFSQYSFNRLSRRATMRAVLVCILMYIHRVTSCHSTFDTSLCYCTGPTDCRNHGLTSVPPVKNPLTAPQVTSMDFRNNKFTRIRSDDFKLLTGLQELDFRDNPLVCCDILELNDVMDTHPSLTKVLGSCVGQDNNTYSITQFSRFPGCAIVSDYCVNITCENGGSCISENRMFKCVCPPKYTGPMCELELCSPLPADIVFVVDSSKSISAKYFDLAKQYTISTTTSWNISQNHFNVAIVTFAGNTTIELPFSDTTTKSSFHSAVRKLKKQGGTSEISSAIRTAEGLLKMQKYSQFYLKPNQYIIVITDGLPSMPSRVNYYTTVPVYAVAMGEDVSHYFLKQITGNMSYIFPYNSDTLGNHLLSALIDSSCNICRTSYESDILFAVDEISRYEKNTNPSIPEILLKILSKMKIGQSESLLSLLTFGNTSDLRFKFNDYTESDRHILQKQPSFLHQRTGSSYNMTAMLTKAHDVLTDRTMGARKSAKKILVIFSRFLNSIDHSLVSVLESMKNESIAIFTIGTDSSDEAFDIMSVIASTSFHIGIVGNIYTSSINTFIEAFMEQVLTIHCQI